MAKFGRCVVGLLGLWLWLGCDDAPSAADIHHGGDMVDGQDVDTTHAGQYLAEGIFTLRMGTTDNIEAVKVFPGEAAGLVLGSKSRKISRLRVLADRLEISRERSYFADDPSESELTNLAIGPDGTWAAITRTLISTDGSGAQTACGGELLLVSTQDDSAFGDQLARLEVGAMPDAVAISDDGRWIAVANERDGPDAWGKCEVPGVVPSISIIAVPDGPASAVERHRVVMIDGGTGPREPEGCAFGRDNDTVLCTLQDSHEVIVLRISALEGKAAPTSADGIVVRLPDDSLGAGPWPDGIVRFVDLYGREAFAIAGEWNDSLIVVGLDGAVLGMVELTASDLPTDLPRANREGYPPFSPDTPASFVYGGKVFIGVSLRHSGAVAFYDVSDATRPRYAGAARVGDHGLASVSNKGSTIAPEGLCAAADGTFLLSANEGENAVTLIRPVQ